MHKISCHNTRIVVLVMAGILCGCWLGQQPSGAGSHSAPAELLLKGASGPRQLAAPSAAWIRDPSTLSAMYQTLQAHLGVKNLDAPDVDFETFGVLLLEMGQKPTGGFAINFDPTQTRMRNGQLVVHVDWDTPAQGMALTQAVSSPFIMLKIDLTDAASVLVLNQNNQTLFELPVE